MIICDTDVMIDILRGHEAALAWLAANQFRNNRPTGDRHDGAYPGLPNKV